MTAADYILWVTAFIGIAVIYGGKRVYEKVSGAKASPAADIAIRFAGIVISAAAMIILYKTGKLI